MMLIMFADGVDGVTPRYSKEIGKIGHHMLTQQIRNGSSKQTANDVRFLFGLSLFLCFSSPQRTNVNL